MSAFFNVSLTLEKNHQRDLSYPTCYVNYKLSQCVCVCVKICVRLFVFYTIYFVCSNETLNNDDSTKAEKLYSIFYQCSRTRYLLLHVNTHFFCNDDDGHIEDNNNDDDDVDNVQCIFKGCTKIMQPLNIEFNDQDITFYFLFYERRAFHWMVLSLWLKFNASIVCSRNVDKRFSIFKNVCQNADETRQLSEAKESI